MTKAIRWRVIVLQVVTLFVLLSSSFAGFYASNFTSNQIYQQLAPQHIVFPATAAQGLPADLNSYAGQQVVNGDQAHAYAEKFIGLHLSEIGKGQPYSYWSGQAMKTTNPTLKAQYQGIADTMFKGATLQSMLNTAWTFSVFGQIAYYAGLALAIAAVVVLGALIFEIYEMTRGVEAVEVIAVPSEKVQELASVR